MGDILFQRKRKTQNRCRESRHLSYGGGGFAASQPNFPQPLPKPPPNIQRPHTSVKHRTKQRWEIEEACGHGCHATNGRLRLTMMSFQILKPSLRGKNTHNTQQTEHNPVCVVGLEAKLRWRRTFVVPCQRRENKCQRQRKNCRGCRTETATMGGL